MLCVLGAFVFCFFVFYVHKKQGQNLSAASWGHSWGHTSPVWSKMASIFSPTTFGTKVVGEHQSVVPSTPSVAPIMWIVLPKDETYVWGFCLCLLFYIKTKTESLNFVLPFGQNHCAKHNLTTFASKSCYAARTGDVCPQDETFGCFAQRAKPLCFAQ